MIILFDFAFISRAQVHSPILRKIMMWEEILNVAQILHYHLEICGQWLRIIKVAVLVSGLFFLLRQVWCQVSLFICSEMHMYTKIMWNLSKNNKEYTQDFSCEFLLLAEIAQSTFDALDSQWVFGSIFHSSILFSSGSERVTRMICWKSIADCHYDV